MELFHFSEAGDISIFVPRPVAVPAARATGMEWLNGPLVWAIDDWHVPLYLFPRDCPRVLAWPTDETTRHDRRAHWLNPSLRMIAYIEPGWVDRLAQTVLHRYSLPGEAFEPLHDAGMWISRTSATPSAVSVISNLPASLAAADVELRIVPDLTVPLSSLQATSLHVSGIRLRNMARGRD